MKATTRIVFSTFLALAGLVLLFGPLAWLFWRELVVAEENRVAQLAESLGTHTEQLIGDAIGMLESLESLPYAPCSPQHIRAMHDAAFGKPHIKAVGYWVADNRQCGAGYVQSDELKPQQADRIYPSGLVAWWPKAQTTLAGVKLFQLRFGGHNVSIDPQMLLATGPLVGTQAALWVEGLQMAVNPPGAHLPSPLDLAPGLTIDSADGRLVSRVSLGTVFPIDIVAAEPIARFGQRYGALLAVAMICGMLLLIGWIVFVMRFSRRRFSLATELRDALNSGRVTVHYQPIMDLDTGDCVGAEALMRWRRETGQMISPEIFIPLAEETGLMPVLTRTVLATTLRELSPLLKNAPHLAINLNVTAEDFDDPSFLTTVRSLLTTAGLNPGSIKLEITERALINDQRVRDLIRDLRQGGFFVAIDDFGTGYSSLSYLQSFDLDILKIDKSFVDAIEKGAATSGVITHVIEMAQTLKMKIVAEGIETRHQAAWLREREVNFGQGFLFSKPLTADQFTEFLARRGATGQSGTNPQAEHPASS